MKQSKIFNPIYGGEKLKKIVAQDVEHRKQFFSVSIIQKIGLSYLKRHKIRRLIEAQEKVNGQLLQFTFDQLLIHSKLNLVGKRLACGAAFSFMMEASKNIRISNIFASNKLCNKVFAAFRSYLQNTTLDQADLENIGRMRKVLGQRTIAKTINFWKLRQIFLRQLNSNVNYIDIVQHIRANYTVLVPFSNFLNSYCQSRQQALLLRTRILTKYSLEVAFRAWRAFHYSSNKDHLFELKARTYQLWLYGGYFHAMFVQKRIRLTILQSYIQRWKTYVGISVEEDQNNRFANKFYINYLQRKYFGLYMKYVFCSDVIKKSKILHILYGDSSMIQQKQAYPIVRTTYVNYFLSLSSESLSPISSAIKCLLAWRRVCGYRTHFAKFVAVFQVRFQILKLRHKLRCWKLASKGRDRYSKQTPKEILLETKTAQFLMQRIQQEYIHSSFAQQNYQYCVSSSQFGIYLIKDQYSAEEDDLLMYKFQSKLLLYSNKQLEGIVADFMSTKNNSDTATFMFSNLIKIWALSRKKQKALNIDKRPNEDRVTVKDFRHMAKMYEKMLTIRYVSFLFSCEMGFGKRFINDEMRRYSTSIIDILRRRFPQIVDYMVQNKNCEFNLVSHSFNTTQPSFLSFNNNSVVSIAYLLNYFLQDRSTNIEQPDFGLFSSFKKFNKYGIVNRAQEATKRNKETQRAVVAERLRKKFPQSGYFNIRSSLNDWLTSCLACAMEKEFLQLYKLRSGVIKPILQQALSRVGVQQTSYMSYAVLGNELGNDFVTQTHTKQINYITSIKQAIHMSDIDAYAINEIYKKSKTRGDNLNDTFDDQVELQQILGEVGQALSSEILISFINQIKQHYQGCLTQNIVNKTLEFVQIMKSLLDQNPNTHIDVYIDDFLSQLDQEQTSIPGKQVQFDEYGDMFQNPGTNSIDKQGKSGLMKAKQTKDFMSQFRMLNPANNTNNIEVEQSGLTVAQRRALMKKLKETEKLESEQQQIQDELDKSRFDQLTLEQTKQLSYFESMLSQSLDGSLLTALGKNDQQITQEQEQMIDAEIEKALIAQGMDPDRAKNEAKRRRVNYVSLKLKQQTQNLVAKSYNSQQQQLQRVIFHNFLINEKTFIVLNVNTLSSLKDKKGRTIKYDKIRDIFQVGRILIQPSDLETYLLKQGIMVADFKVQKQTFLTQQCQLRNSSTKQPKPVKNSSITVLQNMVKFQNNIGDNQESLNYQKVVGAQLNFSELQTKQYDANKLVTNTNNIQRDSKGNYFVLDELGQIKYLEKEEIDTYLTTGVLKYEQFNNSIKNVSSNQQGSSKEEQSYIKKQQTELSLQESEVNGFKIQQNLQFKEQLLMKIIDDRLKLDENGRVFFVDDQGTKFYKDDEGFYVETVDENDNIIRDYNKSPVFESYTIKQDKYQPSISILQKRKRKEREKAAKAINEDQILVIDENGEIVYVNREDISQTNTDDSEISVYNNDQIADDSLLLLNAIRKRRKFLEAIRKRNLRLQKQIEMEYVSDNEYEYQIQDRQKSVNLAQLQREGQISIVKPKRLQYVFESNQIRFKRQTSKPFLSTHVNQYALGLKRSKSIEKMGENHIAKYNCINADSFIPNSRPINIQDSFYFEMHLHTKPTPFVQNGLVKHKLYDYSKTKQQRDLETTMQHIGVRIQNTKIKQDSQGEKFMKDVQDRLNTMKKQQDGFNIIDIVCKRDIVGFSNVGFEDTDIKLEELRAFQVKISTMENKKMDINCLFKRFDGLFSKMTMLVMGEKAKKMQHQIMKEIEKEEEEDKFAIDLETIVNYTSDTRESYQVKQERIERRRLRLAKERIAQQKKYLKEQNDKDEMEAARRLVKCDSEGELVVDPRFDRRKIVLFEPKVDYSDYIRDLVHGRRFVREDVVLENQTLIPFMAAVPLVPPQRFLNYETDNELQNSAFLKQRQMLQTKSRFTKKNRYVSKILTPLPISESQAKQKMVHQLSKTMRKLNTYIHEIDNFESWLEAVHEQEQRMQQKRDELIHKLSDARARRKANQ